MEFESFLALQDASVKNILVRTDTGDLRMKGHELKPNPQLTPPSHVRIGPLTQRLLTGARWYGQDKFPAWQVWADDVEQVLTFLNNEKYFEEFLKSIQNLTTVQHRDARLAEARSAFYLARNGFRILAWEPPGEGNTKGEALVSLPNSPDIFVEVKQPGWQGEIRPRRIAQQKALPEESRKQLRSRKEQDKYLNGEGGPVASHLTAMDVVRRNALPKLTARMPNLVVIMADLRVTPVGLPSLASFVQREFAKPDHDPDDKDDVFTYERLGGVLFVEPEANDDESIDYRAEFVENPGALPSCALPPSAKKILFGLKR